MKKSLIAALAALSLIALSGCGSDPEAAAPSEEAAPATPSDCTPAPASVQSTINAGLKANDGIEAEKDYTDSLETAFIKKSDVNELWYIAGKNKKDKLTGIWIITKEDGSGLTVSLNDPAAYVSNYPKASETPAFKEVADQTADVVTSVVQCVK